MKKHPHILRLMSDQHAANVCGYAGDPWVRTPNLDRLAEQGTIFENCYCTAPICIPGRYSIYTGKLPRQIGTIKYGDPMRRDEMTYMHYFTNRGYQTTCVGKQHFPSEEQMHGWMFRPYGDMEVAKHANMPGYSKELDVTGGNPPKRLAPPSQRIAGMTRAIKNAGAGSTGFQVFDRSVTRESCIHLEDYFSLLIHTRYQGERPLLFETSWKCPHVPFTAPQKLFDYYHGLVRLPKHRLAEDAPPYIATRSKADEPKDEVSDEEVVNARVGYYALVEFIDQQVGEVLQTLERIGKKDDFIVMYTSDHGEMAGEHGLWAKRVFYEQAAKVPMIIAGSGIPKGKRVRENVSLADVFATLCDLAGFDTPTGLYGRSMMPLVFGKDTFGQRIIHAESFTQFSNEHQVNSFMAKKGDIKLIDYCDGHRQLFDLGKDPEEMINLIDNPLYQEIRDELAQSLCRLPEPFRHCDPVWKFLNRPQETAMAV